MAATGPAPVVRPGGITTCAASGYRASLGPLVGIGVGPSEMAVQIGGTRGTVAGAALATRNNLELARRPSHPVASGAATAPISCCRSDADWLPLDRKTKLG
jgi:hypothetical protein